MNEVWGDSSRELASERFPLITFFLVVITSLFWLTLSSPYHLLWRRPFDRYWSVLTDVSDQQTSSSVVRWQLTDAGNTWVDTLRRRDAEKTNTFVFKHFWWDTFSLQNCENTVWSSPECKIKLNDIIAPKQGQNTWEALWWLVAVWCTQPSPPCWQMGQKQSLLIMEGNEDGETMLSINQTIILDL